MQKAPRYIEQYDSLQESKEQKLRVKNGGAIEGVEGGLRLDVFDHDDPDDLQCVCDLPEIAQDYIIQDIEYEENNA
tara:strand:- start:1584 stop:1811 length:228 start_codon:yes stop_codon:yes gene_type:complete